jgi:hypothetical protein
MADRYLLESGAPDGYLLEDASGVLLLEQGDGASPRLWQWRALPLVALGFFAVEEDTRAKDYRLFYGRSTPAAPTATQPFWINRKATFQTVDEEYRAPTPSALHRYRTGYQTVGQPWALRYRPAKSPQDIEPDAARLPLGRLHLYRVGYQTVGQPWHLLYRRPQTRIEIEDHLAARAPNPLPFRGAAPVIATPGQPWYLWPRAQADQTVEPDAVRANYSFDFFFGGEQSVVPPVLGQEWIIRARRRRGR